MAVRPHHGVGFDRVYLLQQGQNESLGRGPFWHYPCAYERKGILYISCTSSSVGPVRHGALIRVPVSSI